MVAPSHQCFVLSPLVAHIHMSARKLFTLAAENVMKPYMAIAAREIHGGTIGYDLLTKVQKLPLSETTRGNRSIAAPEVFKNMFSVRYNKLQPFCLPPLKISAGWILCAVMVGSMKETVSVNLLEAPCFEIQFDEKQILPMIPRYFGKLI